MDTSGYENNRNYAKQLQLSTDMSLHTSIHALISHSLLYRGGYAAMTLPPYIQPGDRVFVQGWPLQTLEVVDCSDRSIVVLRAKNGAVVKVGRLAVVPAGVYGTQPKGA